MSAVPENMSASEGFPEIGKPYYISGLGLATLQTKFDPLSSGADRDTLPKGLKKYAGVIYRLRADPVYSGQEGVVHVPAHEILKHHRIHELPSRAEIAQILKVLTEEPKIPVIREDKELNTLRTRLVERMNTEDLRSLATIIRDSKIMFKDGLHETAHGPLSNVLAHAYETLPGEAFDYLRMLSGLRWPHWLPVMPESRATMQAVVKQRAAKLTFTPEWYQSIGGNPIGMPAPVVPAPAPARSVTIGIIPQRTAPKTASALKASERPEDYKVKFIRADTINAAAPFTRETRIYKQLIASVTTSIEKKIIEAAVFRATQGDMLELSRLLLAPELPASRLAQDFHEQPAMADWSSDDVRSHYVQKLNYWLHQVQVDEKLELEDKPAAIALYHKINKNRSVPSNIVFGSVAAPPPAAEQDNIAPTSAALVADDFSVAAAPAPAPAPVAQAPVADAVNETIVVTAGATAAAQDLVKSLAEETPPHIGETMAPPETLDTVTSTVVFQLRRQPGNGFSTGVNEELDHLRNEKPENQEAIALGGLASAVLSPVAFAVFSGVSLRSEETRLTLDKVAEALGVDSGAATAIFNGAAKIVRESVIKLADNPALKLG